MPDGWNALIGGADRDVVELWNVSRNSLSAQLKNPGAYDIAWTGIGKGCCRYGLAQENDHVYRSRLARTPWTLNWPLSGRYSVAVNSNIASRRCPRSALTVPLTPAGHSRLRAYIQ
jgi:hypothetical protein